MHLTLTLTFALVCLYVSHVQTYTLYKWILDSKMRFNYDPDPRNALGVSNWPITYREKCGGIHQSPVDIQTDRVRYGVACGCPNMVYKETMLHGELKNNGHSTTFEPESNMVIKMHNIPYRNGTYYFNDFHLHYGGVRGRNFELQGLRFRGSGAMSAGSEHTIDGLRYEGELHFVFYNGKYGSLEIAEKEEDGVAIIVIMVQKVPDMNINSMKFSKFLESNIPYVSPYLANVSTTVDISMFFNRACEFYTYTGSTTTPVCHESVRWMILKDPLQVTEKAWFLLTSLRSRGDFNSRFGNYRSTQPLNDRVVEANFRREDVPALPQPDGEIIDMLQRNSSRGIMMMMPIDSARGHGRGQRKQLELSSSGVNTGDRSRDMMQLDSRTQVFTPDLPFLPIPRSLFESRITRPISRAPVSIMQQPHILNMPMNEFTSALEPIYPANMQISTGTHNTQMNSRRNQDIFSPGDVFEQQVMGTGQQGFQGIIETYLNGPHISPAFRGHFDDPLHSMSLRGVQLPGQVFQVPSIQTMGRQISRDPANSQHHNIGQFSSHSSLPSTQNMLEPEMGVRRRVPNSPTQFMMSSPEFMMSSPESMMSSPEFMMSSPVIQDQSSLHTGYMDNWPMYLQHMMSKHGSFPGPVSTF